MTIALTFIAALAWGRWIFLALNHRLTVASVYAPLLWTILAVVL